jgi:8-oxo-dGTP pyrophosphatase MutT (NUDIX family)
VTARGGPEGLRIRTAVRALIVDPDDHLLLVRFQFPRVTVWATPGGGKEAEESDEAALRRELDEELGLTDVVIGPHVWSRLHIIPFLDGRWDGQRDHIFLVRTPRFEPAPRLSWEQLRSERLHAVRWWSGEELAAAAEAGVRFAPLTLPSRLASLLTHGPPPQPLDVGL